MTTIKDSNRYPKSICAKYLNRYIKRNCLCIVFFYNTKDLKSITLSRNLKFISRKYPSVFCYKLGWETHKKYYQNVYNCNMYDVTIWKNSHKVKIFTNPTYTELDSLFEYVNKIIFNEDHHLYLSVLEEEHKENDELKNIIINYMSLKNAWKSNSLNINSLISSKNKYKSIDLEFQPIKNKDFNLPNKTNTKKTLNPDFKWKELDAKAANKKDFLNDTYFHKAVIDYNIKLSVAESLLDLKYSTQLDQGSKEIFLEIHRNTEQFKILKYKKKTFMHKHQVNIYPLLIKRSIFNSGKNENKITPIKKDMQVNSKNKIVSEKVWNFWKMLSIDKQSIYFEHSYSQH